MVTMIGTGIFAKSYQSYYTNQFYNQKEYNMESFKKNRNSLLYEYLLKDNIESTLKNTFMNTNINNDGINLIIRAGFCDQIKDDDAETFYVLRKSIEQLENLKEIWFMPYSHPSIFVDFGSQEIMKRSKTLMKIVPEKYYHLVNINSTWGIPFKKSDFFKMFPNVKFFLVSNDKYYEDSITNKIYYFEKGNAIKNTVLEKHQLIKKYLFLVTEDVYNDMKSKGVLDNTNIYSVEIDDKAIIHHLGYCNFPTEKNVWHCFATTKFKIIEKIEKTNL